VNAEQAKAKVDAALDALKDKQRSYFLAKVEADKREKIYLDAQKDPNLERKVSHKLCGDWYEADRLVEKARVEAREADAAYEKAQKEFENAMMEDVT
jgi:uridine kinase